MQKGQQDVDVVKENYEILQLTNTDLLVCLCQFQYFNKVPKHKDDNHYNIMIKSLPREKMKISERKQ